ncbi:MAG: RHS repeat-associated core domain-containing protein [Candidatus Izemoplasmatales bacterium]
MQGYSTPLYQIRYKYNDQGYRTQKAFYTYSGYTPILTQTVDYELIDDKVVYETDGSYGILYTYDYDGTLISFNYDLDITDQNSGSEYFYIRNQMGDITHIATSDGTVVVHYIYDAYGNITDTDITAGYSAIADANPYRYRGYRYDLEISMYYLNSRYYNPEVGRFLNADGMLGQQGNVVSSNMFIYCQNNPIMYVDEDGEFWNIAAGFIIGGLISATVSVASQLITTGEVDLVQTGIAFLAGGASGALAATGIGLAGSIIANAGIGGVTDTVSQLASTGSFAELDPISIVASTIMGGVAGWIGGPGMKNASNPLAQADINLSVLRQLNSEMPSQLYGDLISDTLSGIGQIAAREVGKQTGKFALGATVAGAVVTGVNIIVDFFRG